jgi:hypothetical protein
MAQDAERSAADKGKSQYLHVLFDDVLRGELELIGKRREVILPRIVKRDASPITEKYPDGPSTQEGEDEGSDDGQEKDNDAEVTKQREQALDAHLAGLAFSGGGIRSASFAIGVLQGLAELKLLNWFDYLSTVSGGGYAGGWLAAWLIREGSPINVENQLDPSRIRESKSQRHFAKNPKSNPVEWKEYPKKRVLDEEPEPVTHLRAYSSYLTPRGGFFSTDTWAMLAIYLRNVSINLLVLLPLLFFLVLLVRWIIEFYSWSLNPAVGADGTQGQAILFVVFLVGLSLGLFGLGYNARAIGGLRAIPRTFPVKPRELFRGVLLPLLIAAAMVAPSYEAALNFVRMGATPPGYFKATLAYVVSPACLLLHVVSIGGFLFLLSLVRLSRGDPFAAAPKQRSASFGLIEPFAALCAGSVAGILISLTYGLLGYTAPQPWLRATIGPPVFLVEIVLGFTVLVGLLGGRINELKREWSGRLAGSLLRGAVFWLIVVGVIVYGPAVLIGLGALGALAGPAARAVVAAVWAAITGAGVQAGRSPKTGAGQGSPSLEWLCSLAPPVFLAGLLTMLSLVTTVALNRVPSEAPPFSAALSETNSAPDGAAGLTGAQPPSQPSPAAATSIAHTFNASCLRYLEHLRQHHGWAMPIALVITALVCWTFASLVDVNLFSLHAFYANRLIRAFLGASRPNCRWAQRWAGHDRKVEAGAPTNAFGSHRDADPVTDFDDEDDIDLVDLKIGGPLKGRFAKSIEDQGKPVACYWGPHYLINTTMNLVANDNLAWRDRKAEAFCLTPLYCGSKSTGFALATDDTRGNLTLGRAIAVSGAAVDPNMNFHQSPAMTALLTLFNARLGIWIQNPQGKQRLPTWERGRGFYRGSEGWFARGPGLGFPLIGELFGQTSSHSDYVHVSDGGHFENLGVYELLRRRCRYVVAVDATENANATSDNLGILVRLARIDLGIRINLDTAPLALQGPEQYSKTHVVIGQIRYDDVHPNAMPGILVYIRASVTGDEPPDVQQYANNHPEFPRQSTVDQFFDEDQFESYRALGGHVATAVFTEAAADLQDWLKTFVEGPESKPTKEEIEYAGQRSLVRLFGSLRNRWQDQPTGDQASYYESVQAFVKLQRELRDKPALAPLGKELYPELGDDARITDLERVALHTHEEILQLIENAWLGLGLDRRPGTEIGRGWMNSFRRLTSTASFRRFWPLLRAQYNPDFQSFCERLLRLDADDPRLVELVPATDGPDAGAPYADVLEGPISSMAKQVQNLACEFAREWPDFVYQQLGKPSGESLDHLGPRYVHQLIAGSVCLTIGGQDSRAAWLIVQPPKHHVPALDQSQDFIVGILIITPATDPSDGYNLFYWIRPAHRSSGIGEKIIVDKRIVTLDWELTASAIQEGKGRKRQVRVRYPATGVRDDAWTRNRWFSFFALYDFKPEAGHELEPGEEWVLCRDLKEKTMAAPAAPEAMSPDDLRQGSSA